MGVIAAVANTAGTLALRFLVLALNDSDVQNKAYKISKAATKQLIKASGQRAEKTLLTEPKKAGQTASQQ